MGNKGQFQEEIGGMGLRVAIVGGGAAGYFAAINLKERRESYRVTLFESSSTPLEKVRLSGGGRCNLTNATEPIDSFLESYPRGARELRALFREFSPKQTIEWFESRGVQLVTQEDYCIFPRSQDSGTIISLFLRESSHLGVESRMGCRVVAVEREESGTLTLSYKKRGGGAIESESFDRVIVTTGGSPKREGLEWLERAGHKIVEPLPSLYSFKISDHNLRELSGVVVERVKVTIEGTKIGATGALLLTHWGMSGPAILKLSSFGARVIGEQNYNFGIRVNWSGDESQEAIIDRLKQLIGNSPAKQLGSLRPYALYERVWLTLLERGGFDRERRVGSLSEKGLRKLSELISNDRYKVSGRAPNREEFVTSGGVSLRGVNMKTLESRAVAGLFFAGEVLDIDALTGGYNLQAAWTTAFVASKLGEG